MLEEEKKARLTILEVMIKVRDGRRIVIRMWNHKPPTCYLAIEDERVYLLPSSVDRMLNNWWIECREGQCFRLSHKGDHLLEAIMPLFEGERKRKMIDHYGLNQLATLKESETVYE